MHGGLVELIEAQAGVAPVPSRVATSASVEGWDAVGHGGQGAVNDVDAGLRGHQVDHVAGACGVVGVQVDRDGDVIFQLADEVIGVVGKQKVCHIL